MTLKGVEPATLHNEPDKICTVCKSPILHWRDVAFQDGKPVHSKHGGKKQVNSPISDDEK